MHNCLILDIHCSVQIVTETITDVREIDVGQTQTSVCNELQLFADGTNQQSVKCSSRNGYEALSKQQSDCKGSKYGSISQQMSSYDCLNNSTKLFAFFYFRFEKVNRRAIYRLFLFNL